jgi:hypothetical protein
MIGPGGLNLPAPPRMSKKNEGCVRILGATAVFTGYPIAKKNTNDHERKKGGDGSCARSRGI